jgi:hypothetical protein
MLKLWFEKKKIVLALVLLASNICCKGNLVMHYRLCIPLYSGSGNERSLAFTA